MELPNDIQSCHKLIKEQSVQIQTLQEQVKLLLSKIAELEDRLNKNSRNSNKPPSSDGLKKPKIRPAFPRKENKKNGGQQGHKGKTLEMVTIVDHVELHLPQACSCGNELDISQAQVLEVRQVFDIPPPKLEITEHRKLQCSCEYCGSLVKGEFPKNIKAPVQYGNGVRSLVVLLNIAFKLPINKIKTLFNDLFGYAINESTIINATQKCYQQLEASEQVIRKSLLQKIVAHFDETGLRVKGKLHWLHVCCTDLFTYLFVHGKRGKQALEDVASVLPDFKNRAIHDCWSSYFKFSQCLHGICGAHLLRELIALEEKKTQWAVWFKRYLMTLYLMTDKGKNQLTNHQQQKALLLFEKIWNHADRIEPPPKKSTSGRGKPKATKGRNLLIRLKKHQEAVLAFAFYKEVPFTNNQAERDLRPAKIKQKVAGSFRTFEGAQIYARIHGFISTTRKHQFSIFKELQSTFDGVNFLTKSKTS